EERRVKVSWSRGVPGTVHVICQQVGPIEVFADLIELDIGVFVLTGGQGSGQEIMLAGLRAERVKLMMELRQQSGEVRDILRAKGVAVAGIVWILPIDIEAIKNVGSRPGSAGGVAINLRQVAQDEFVDAGLDERRPIRRFGSSGEVRGPGPAADGDHDLEIWIQLLQFT